MANNYTRWYREGTVSATQNSNVITGKDTLWLAIGLKAGDMFSTDNVTEYEIDTITDNTHLVLKTNYTGSTVSNVKYRIIRNWTANSTADVAAMASELLGDVARYLDKDLQTLTGKSAYKSAVDNGFTGTESEWLESLKAAGEWVSARTRLTTLENQNLPSRVQTLESERAGTRLTTLEGYNAGSRLTALESVNASSRLATLEGYNAGTRLTAIETVNTNQATEISNILDRGGFHHSSYRHWELPFHLRGKYLGGTISAAQYDAICGTNGANLFDVQLGDNWTHYATPSTNTAGEDWNWQATVIERTGNGVYLMIRMIDKEFFETNKHSRIHSTNDTSIGFANTEMWTQNLGLIETWLSEHGFPTQYLKEWKQYYYDLPDSTGAATYTGLTGKLHLMRICDYSEKDYETTGMKRAEYPYSYFKRIQLKNKIDTVSCDPISATRYGRCMAIPYCLVTQSMSATEAYNYLTVLAYIAA